MSCHMGLFHPCCCNVDVADGSVVFGFVCCVILCCSSLLSMSSLWYHVTCVTSLRKKLVEIQSKTDICAAIKKTFALSDSDEICLQAPYEDDWLDMDDLNDLPSGGKLQFIIKQQGNFCSAVFLFFLYFIYHGTFLLCSIV